MKPEDRPDTDLGRAVARLVESLREALRDRPRLRALVHDLAWLVAKATEDESAAATPEPPSPPATPPEPKSPEPVTPAPPLTPDDIERLKIGGARVNEPMQAVIDQSRSRPQPPRPVEVAPPPPREPTSGTVPDLALVARRAHLKAEACRHLIWKRRRLAEGAEFEHEIKDKEEDLKRRMKEPDGCFIPVLFREDPDADDDSLESLAKCLENLAAAAELVDQWSRTEGPVPREVLALLAEAQSAVREAVRCSRLPYVDRDQDDTFLWLRAETQKRQVYLERYMRAEDPADPADAPRLARRINEDRETLTRIRQRREILNRLRYLTHTYDRRGDKSPHTLEQIRECLKELQSLGVRADDPRLLDALQPVADILDFPDNPHLQRAVELARQRESPRAEHQDSDADAAEDDEKTGAVVRDTPQIAQAREILRGKVVLLIGGERREHALQNLEQAFACEWRWLTKREHASAAPWESAIARPEVYAVFFLTRFANTHDGPAVHRMCERYGKLYIALPGGYHPAQVAHRFLAQTSRHGNSPR